MTRASGRPRWCLAALMAVASSGAAQQVADTGFRPGHRSRRAVFGEAAMFSAQLSGPARTPMGMNAPRASGNAQFAVNVMHWLTGLLEP